LYRGWTGCVDVAVCHSITAGTGSDLRVPTAFHLQCGSMEEVEEVEVEDETSWVSDDADDEVLAISSLEAWFLISINSAQLS